MELFALQPCHFAGNACSVRQEPPVYLDVASMTGGPVGPHPETNLPEALFSDAAVGALTPICTFLYLKFFLSTARKVLNEYILGRAESLTFCLLLRSYDTCVHGNVQKLGPPACECI